MPTYKLPDGRPVHRGEQFTYDVAGDAITFPPNWLEHASAEDLSRLGIVVSPDAEPAAPDLAELKRLKIADIDAAAAEAIAPIVTAYSQAERDTWPIQEAEAVAWIADSSVPTPMLDAIATPRGMTKADLVASVMAKAAAFKTLAGSVFGKRRALVDQVDAAETIDEVVAITW